MCSNSSRCCLPPAPPSTLRAIPARRRTGRNTSVLKTSDAPTASNSPASRISRMFVSRERIMPAIFPSSSSSASRTPHASPLPCSKRHASPATWHRSAPSPGSANPCGTAKEPLASSTWPCASASTSVASSGRLISRSMAVSCETGVRNSITPRWLREDDAPRGTTYVIYASRRTRSTVIISGPRKTGATIDAISAYRLSRLH